MRRYNAAVTRFASLLRPLLLGVVSVAACGDASSLGAPSSGGAGAADAPAGDLAIPDAPAAGDAAAPDAPRTAPPEGSPGCLAPAAAGVQRLSVTAAGRARSAVLAVPSSYDAARAYPLVFVFHSGGRTGESARDYFGFAGIAEDRAIFVYPDGLGGDWDLESPAGANPDVALFDAIVAHASGALCLDRARVFATGSSAGAYFVNQLGCRRGAVLRAIAPHAGGGPWDVASAYGPDGRLRCADAPPAAMVFHGDQDRSVALSEGEGSRDHWTWANGCAGGAPPAATAPLPSFCRAYAGCAKPVVWCPVAGGGHRIWDGGPKATWDFFASF